MPTKILPQDIGSGVDFTISEVSLSDGTAALPSLAFASDQNTGIYGNGLDRVSVATGGTARLHIDNSGFMNILGLDVYIGATSKLYLDGGTDTYIYEPSANQIDFVTSGSQRFAIAASGLITSLGKHEFSDGSVAAPAISFGADPDTGIYRFASNELSITLGGVERLRVSPGQTRIISTQLGTNSGTAAAPAYTFTNDEDMGIYRSAADILSISAGGVQQAAFATTSIFFNQPVTVNDGAAATPTYTFNTDIDTGFYRDSANVLGFAVSGGNAGLLGVFSGTTQFQGRDGSVASPYWSFVNDPNTGFFRGGIDFLSVSCGGTEVASFAGTGVGSAFLPGVNNTYALGSAALGWTRLFMMGGSAASPSYTFRDDTNTGITNLSADALGISTGGGSRVTIENSWTTILNTLRVQDGLVTAPGIVFDADSDTGIYRITADTLGISTAGTERLRIAGSGTGITSTLRLYEPDGTAALPAYSFSGDTDTGIYRGASNFTHFAGGGARVGYIGGNGNSANFSGVSSTGTHIINTVGTQEGSNTVNSTTRAVDVAGSSKVFTVSTANGDGALVYCNFTSSTVTVLGASGTIVASATPGAGQLGIHKSASSHVVNFTTGSSASSTFASWAACAVGASINSVG